MSLRSSTVNLLASQLSERLRNSLSSEYRLPLSSIQTLQHTQEPVKLMTEVAQALDAPGWRVTVTKKAVVCRRSLRPL